MPTMIVYITEMKYTFQNMCMGSSKFKLIVTTYTMRTSMDRIPFHVPLTGGCNCFELLVFGGLISNLNLDDPRVPKLSFEYVQIATFKDP